jgi:drug/metabolite transporter (DMT)-like permease
MSAVFYSCNYALIKVITQFEPTASPFLLVFLRSLACCIFLTPVGKLEAQDRTVISSLLSPFKVLDKTTSVVAIGHICYVMMLVFVCIKQLPIVDVAIFMNMGPILTVLLAAVLNREKITWVLIAHVSMAFTGVILIVAGSSSQDER